MVDRRGPLIDALQHFEHYSTVADHPWVKLLNERLPMSVVGLMGGLTTFFLSVREDGKHAPHLRWTETDRIEWGTLMLFGGGLTLGILLERSGAAADLGATLIGGGFQSPFVLISIVVISSILISEFASNTAAASVIIPVVIGVTVTHGLGAEVTTAVVLAATFGASFSFMLPVSTPPNAIVYGTGRIKAGDMRRAGLYFDVIGAVLTILYLGTPW